MSRDLAAIESAPPTGSARGAARRLAGSFGFKEVEPSAKAGLVRGVFDRVAQRYDLMNDLAGGGLHRLWKEALIDWLAPRKGLELLDVAGGTGDIGLRTLRRLDGQARVTSCDINHAMLTVGRDRALDAGWLAEIAWVVGDAQALPFADRSFDAFTIAFGLRNVTDIERALLEARRILRPGGRFLCLEFSRLLLPGLERLYDAYSFNVVPVIGRVVAKDAGSYRYLVESIRRFPDQDALARLIRDVGFDQVRHRNLSGGIAAIHSAWRL